MNTEAKKRTPSAPSKAMDEVQKRKGVPFSLKFYHGRMDLSRDKSDFFAKKVFEEKNCFRCGKLFIPTKPEYKWQDCCSYTCWLHRDDGKEDHVVNGKPVAQFNKSGVRIATYPNTVEAARVMGVKPDSIRRCCLGKSRTSASFVWVYVEDLP